MIENNKKRLKTKPQNRLRGVKISKLIVYTPKITI